MQAQNKMTLLRRAVRPMTAMFAAAACCGAWADEPSPYYIGVTQSFTHDTNVYGSPSSISDTYSSTGLTGGFDQGIGRQRVYANANVRYNKYRSETTLDNTSYGVGAGWDWATIEQLSGSLTANATQGLTTSGGNGTLPPTERNVAKTDQLGASVRWGGAGVLSLESAYAHSRVNYSSPAYLASQSSADSASAGGSYRVGPDIRLGGGLRFTRTVSPHAVANTPNPGTNPDNYSPNTANGRNVDLTADWSLTTQTGVTARLSWTRQSNSAATSLDFSGLTGAVSARYAPTAKLTFGASIGRDAGTNAGFFNVPTAAPTAPSSSATPTTPATPVAPTASQGGLSQNSQTSDSYSLNAGYAATAKINVTAGAAYNRSKLVNTVTVGGVPTPNEADDNTRSYSLGVDYAAARSWQLGCKLAHLARSVSGTGGFSYSGNSIGCSAQFTLR